MMNNKDNGMVELSDEMLEGVSGGIIVDDGDGKTFWLVRQDGTVISPVPGRDKAIQFAKEHFTSPRIMTKEEYARHYGRELKW